MRELVGPPKAYDHRIELLVDASNTSFIESVAGNEGIKYALLFEEGQRYAGDTDNPVFVPKGKAWIKMRAELPAGQGFNFVFEKAEQLKRQATKLQG